MTTLNNKIDFVLFVTAEHCNPNGDPLNGNRPRVDAAGNGEISDVCIKRKIRNRMIDMGYEVFVQSDDKNVDGYKSLSERAKAAIGNIKDPAEYARKACEKWIDVRAFGQVFAFKSDKKSESKSDKNGVSVPVRGPVTICTAVSVDTVDVTTMQITKSVNSDSAEKKSSDTMGAKHYVPFGLYKICGAINVQLAEKTGFSEEDAEAIKQCLATLFENDASSARPEGSMEVVAMYWWKHDSKLGKYNSAVVHRSVSAAKKEGVVVPSGFDDYVINVQPLDGLVAEKIV